MQDKDSIKYQADIECLGKLADVVTFMHLFNSSEDLTKVTRFTFSSKKTDTDEIKVSMTVSKLVVGKNAVSASTKQPSPTAQASAAK